MILLTNWISLFWYLNMFLVMDSSIVESALVVVFYVFWEWRCACFFYAYFNFPGTSSSFYEHFRFVVVIKIGTIVPLHKIEFFNQMQFLDNQII